MPRPKKRRGVQHERKRAHAEEEDIEIIKKRKVDDGEGDSLVNDSDDHNGQAFFGMLSQQEEEYFSHAHEMLELNQLGNIEDTTLFLANVFQEARGKELKIASSQKCSRLLEHMIRLSSASQLKGIFSAFSGHFLDLIQHRFASHSCEMLFLQAAPVVTKELTSPLEDQATLVDGEIHVSTENLFLHMSHEMNGNHGRLIVHDVASHVLRVLLVVLSGLPLARAINSSRSKHKPSDETTFGPVSGRLLDETSSRSQILPRSFDEAVHKIVQEISVTLSRDELRALAYHPKASPVLQLLIELESSETWKKRTSPDRSILRTLLGDEYALYKPSGRFFVWGLLYDAVGSHLLESMIRFAPGEMFKCIYRLTIKDFLGEAAENDVAGYVAVQVLGRLGKKELQEAAGIILSRYDALVRRSRFVVLRTVIDRYVARDLDLKRIARAIKDASGHQSPTERLQTIVKWNAVESAKDVGTKETAESKRLGRVHGSLLAQAMLAQAGPLAELVYEGLIDTPASVLIAMAQEPAVSRLLQASVTGPDSPLAFRRRFLAAFSQQAAVLAAHPVGSHLIDALWDGTEGLQHVRERIAQTLMDAEDAVTESYHGRRLWRKWKMNYFKQRRSGWNALSKAHSGRGHVQGSSKASIDQARARYALTHA